MEITPIPIELLYKKLEGRLSSEEEAVILEWLKVPAHRDYLKHLEHFYRLSEETGTSKEELEEAWKLFQNRIKSHRRFIPKRSVWYAVAIAASVIIMWGVFIIWNDPLGKPDHLDKLVQIRPGQRNAILELANGQSYDLGDLSGRENLKISSHIVMDSCRLSYTKPDSVSSAILSFNTLSVPRGGEFQIMLEDGTKVWLNSDTRLKYPEIFSNSIREVYLEGEAYFEVAKNPARPFIVYSGIQKITVLGTSFGITDYPGEANLSTTLVEGKVKVEYPQVSSLTYQLNPGERIVCDRNELTVSQASVDVWEYVAWKEGKYVFARQRLEDMLNTLSRWYDFQVFYQNPEAKEVLFSGELRRFDSFNDVLRLIGKTSDVSFAITGNTVSVRK